MSSQRKDNARTVAFDQETKKTLLTAASKEGLWAKVFLELAFEFGLRKSDLLKLTFSQFDLIEGVLTQTVSKTRETMQLTLRPDLVLLIRELSHGKRSADRMFPVKDFRYAWKRICEAAAVRDGKSGGFVLHDTRRTATKELISAGAAPRDVVAVLGWKSQAMLQRYGFAETSSIRAALERRTMHQQTLAASTETGRA